MDENYAKELLERYNSGQCTDGEKAIVESWFLTLKDEGSIPDEQKIEQIREEVWASLPLTHPPVKQFKWARYAVAASVLLLLSIGGYFIFHTPIKNEVATVKPGTFKNDALPGNKAILTLSNGQHIAVNEAGTGTITNQGATKIQKNADGKLTYQTSESTNPDASPIYNTLTTLRGGGKHTLQMADGTLAVLDAGSSIKYPVAFSGKERQVEITGQVYFEVVHKSAMPFSVKVKNQVIRDLGTRFNINAYDDEPEIRTTLIEGGISVQIVNSSATKGGTTLKPGQQAIVTPDGTLVTKSDVDLETTIAWKNDLFKFTSNTSLPAIMRQLSRWYDLGVVYEGTGKHYNFGGDIPRNSKLSEVLKILQYSGVRFSVDGKKIIVYQ